MNTHEVREVRLGGLGVHTAQYLAVDLSAVPVSHIKRFTKPAPRYLMPLASKDICIHVHMTPDTHKLENNKNTSPEQNKGAEVLPTVLTTLGSFSVVNLYGWEAFIVQFKGLQLEAGVMAQGLSVGCSQRDPGLNCNLHMTAYSPL